MLFLRNLSFLSMSIRLSFQTVISARKQEVPGEFPIFISDDSTTAESSHVTFMRRVEDVARAHYAKEGFPESSSCFSSVCFLALLHLLLFRKVCTTRAGPCGCSSLFSFMTSSFRTLRMLSTGANRRSLSTSSHSSFTRDEKNRSMRGWVCFEACLQRCEFACSS